MSASKSDNILNELEAVKFVLCERKMKEKFSLRQEAAVAEWVICKQNTCNKSLTLT